MQDSLPSLDSGEITSQSKSTTFWIFLSGKCGMIEPCEWYTAGPKPSACARGEPGFAHWGTPDSPIAERDDRTALLLSMAVAKQLLINPDGFSLEMRNYKMGCRKMYIAELSKQPASPHPVPCP